MDARKTAALSFCLALAFSGVHAQKVGELGTPITHEQFALWDINVLPDGTGLPEGEGTVTLGEALYQAQCLACHGAKLEGGIGTALVGGEGSLATEKPLKTIGSYWPYATTLYDYVRRTMPFQTPQSLTDDEVYSVVAYLLHENDIVPADIILNAESLAKIEMPNRNNFYVDDRPDTANERCMTDCLDK